MKDFIQKHKNKISIKVLLLTIIPITIILAFTITLCTSSISNSATELVYQQLISKNISDCSSFESILSQSIASLSMESQDYALEHYLKTLSIGNKPENNPYRSRAVEFLDALYEANPDILFTWVVDYDTSTAISNTEAGWSLSKNDWQPSTCPWYAPSRWEEGAYITDSYLSPYGEIPVISIAAPVKNTRNNQVLGVVGISFQTNSFQDFILSAESEAPSPGSYTLIFDSNGTVVASREEAYTGIILAEESIKNVAVENNRNPGYTLYSFELEGVTMVGVASDLGINQWKTLTLTPQSSITGQIQAFTRNVAFIIAIGLILLIIFMSFVSFIISHPIKEITKAAQEIAKGNYSIQLAASSKDEIGDLAKAVNTSIAVLRHQSLFDPLTGIYNSRSLINEAQQLMNSFPERAYAIIRMDIANFKLINDFFGWDKGDELLKYIAQIVTEQMTSTGCYGRITGDIFCMCREYTSKEELIEFLGRVSQHIKTFPIRFHLIPYFGIVINRYPDVPITVLFDWANLALKTIKGNSLQNYAFYDSFMRDSLIEKDKIEQEMYSALKNRQFQVYLQPKCDISTSQVVGAESLVRWIHPTKGIVSPGVFIPLFEQNGFVARLDEYIWEETCKIIKSWVDKGYGFIPISVNVSRIHIYDPEFTNKLSSLIEKYQIPVDALELEFTESAFINDIGRLYEIMSCLQKKGFVLSMDDFGSGYSSLNMLKNGPMDIIKIDQGFLSETLVNNSGKIIMRNIISMINQLQKKIVAEGVETEEQANFLLHAGCSTAQGYYYSKPITPMEFESFAFKRQLCPEE